MNWISYHVVVSTEVGLQKIQSNLEKTIWQDMNLEMAVKPHSFRPG